MRIKAITKTKTKNFLNPEIRLQPEKSHPYRRIRTDIMKKIGHPTSVGRKVAGGQTGGEKAQARVYRVALHPVNDRSNEKLLPFVLDRRQDIRHWTPEPRACVPPRSWGPRGQW